MATVRCWALHGNVQDAINYVINEDKTEKHLVEGNGTNPNIAGLKWKADKNLSSETKDTSDEIVGFHFQQSFEEGSISYEEAFEIGRKWIDKITGGNHDYVMSVHTDTKNPHVHFIVNPTNNVTGKQMQLFYKRDLPAFKEISDRICVEHGKEILSEPKGRGRTYYEWMMANQGDSIKDVITKTLDTVIDKVQNYDDLKKYLIKLGYAVEDGMEGGNTSTLEKEEGSLFGEYKISINKSLVDETKETETAYFVRIPNTKGKEFFYLPKEGCEWTSDNVTCFSSFLLSEEFKIYDKQGNECRKKTGNEIKDCWEEKNKDKTKERSGLRIKAPFSKKFMRCHRLEENEKGEGYSLNEILERIESNGRLRTDEKILEFLKGDFDKTQFNDNLNKFYEDAHIKTKWKSSKFYNMSKKERYVAYKVKQLQGRMNKIHEARSSSDDIINLDDLKQQRKEMRATLSETKKELSTQESFYNEIYMDKLSDRLEVTQEELDEFADLQIKPLQELKSKLKEDIKKLSERINKAETKIKKNQKKERV